MLADRARDQGLRLTALPADYQPGSEADEGQMEHHVWKTPDDKRVVKLTRVGQFGLWPVAQGNGWDLRAKDSTPLRYLARFNLANTTFNDDTVLHGILAQRGSPHIQILTSQPAYDGDILGTQGKDKDHLDVFIGPDPDSQSVLIINQGKLPSDSAPTSPISHLPSAPRSSVFDEHKIMLGFPTPIAALRGYLASYSPGWKGLQSAVPTTVAALKAWIASGNTTTPVTRSQFQQLEQNELPLSAAARKVNPAAADMSDQSAFLAKAARAGSLVLPDASDEAAVAALLGQNPTLYHYLAAQWRVSHARDNNGNFVQTTAAHAIFNTLYGKNRSLLKLDDAGTRARRFTAEAARHTRGDLRSGETEPDTPSSELQRAEKARLIAWARDAHLLLHRLPEEWTPFSTTDVGNMEHHVFIAGNRMVKITQENQYGLWPVPHLAEFDLRNSASTPARYLQRLQTTNEVLGDDIILHGILTDRQGMLQIITSQPLYQGQLANAEWASLPEESPVEQRNAIFHAGVAPVRAAMAAQGFQPAGHDNRTYYRPADNTAIFDAHLSNLMWVDTDPAVRLLIPFDVTVMNPTGRLREYFQSSTAPLSANPSPSDSEIQPPTSSLENPPLPAALRVPHPLALPRSSDTLSVDAQLRSPSHILASLYPDAAKSALHPGADDRADRPQRGKPRPSVGGRPGDFTHLLDWARKHGRIFSPQAFQLTTDPARILAGGEHLVYAHQFNGRLYKALGSAGQALVTGLGKTAMPPPFAAEFLRLALLLRDGGLIIMDDETLMPQTTSK
ncbi:hypothetical protein [Prosthecobacter sp.]|uniref:hypothetical protein n=1 Tax=Prosthecobacter sp. TaxID=1965333 RepID=UPI002487BF2F|nr:hypothetical protein [Prosthecobacter sp.]MDI1313515.1 hypothetical protein [Prosthecobacter sp.]